LPSPQKAKGNSWERTVARFLTETHGASFLRVPNSGAFIGGNNAGRISNLDAGQVKSFRGDIIPPENWDRCNIEAKSRQSLGWHQILTGSCKLLDSWIEQCMVVHQPSDFTVIFFKIDRQGQYVAVRLSAEQKIHRPDNYMLYTRSGQDVWLISELSAFWTLNKNIIEEICTNSPSPQK
jgi:hypothetical protein